MECLSPADSVPWACRLPWGPCAYLHALIYISRAYVILTVCIRGCSVVYYPRVCVQPAWVFLDIPIKSSQTFSVRQLKSPCIPLAIQSQGPPLKATPLLGALQVLFLLEASAAESGRVDKPRAHKRKGRRRRKALPPCDMADEKRRRKTGQQS